MNRRDSFKTAAAGLLAAVWPRRSEMTNLKTTSNLTTVYDPADFGDDCQEWHDPLFQALNEEARDFDRQTGLASLMHGATGTHHEALNKQQKPVAGMPIETA